MRRSDFSRFEAGDIVRYSEKRLLLNSTPHSRAQARARRFVVVGADQYPERVLIRELETNSPDCVPYTGAYSWRCRRDYLTPAVVEQLIADARAMEAAHE